MVDFIRVRDKSTKHEYDAPASEVETNPDLYEVLEKEPVSAPREPSFYVPESRKTPAKA